MLGMRLTQADQDPHIRLQGGGAAYKRACVLRLAAARLLNVLHNAQKAQYCRVVHGFGFMYGSSGLYSCFFSAAASSAFSRQ